MLLKYKGYEIVNKKKTNILTDQLGSGVTTNMGDASLPACQFC